MTIIEMLELMMEFKPVTADIERVNALTEFTANYLKSHGVAVEKHSMDGRHCLYASTCAGEQPDVLFNAHLDVVPAEDEMFDLREDDDGWLHGRGTHDCLGNCALLVCLLCRLQEKNSTVKVGVAFSTDEETGGETTAFLAGCIPAPRRLVIVADGSGNSVVVAQKGVLTLELVAHGTACHSATPWEGENAIDKLIDGYLKIRELFPKTAPPDEWRKTLAATIVQAGNAHNRVPDQARMTLNVRFTENESATELIEAMRDATAQEVVPKMTCDPVFCDPDDEEVKKLIAHMRDGLNREIAIKRSNGATDARHFTRFNLPIAIIGVNGRDLHGAGEALEKQSLLDYETMLLNYLERQ